MHFGLLCACKRQVRSLKIDSFCVCRIRFLSHLCWVQTQFQKGWDLSVKLGRRRGNRRKFWCHFVQTGRWFHLCAASFPEGLGRQLSECLSVLQHLFHSSEWLNSSDILSSVPPSPSRCQSADAFPPLSLINVPTRSPSPRLSLRADVDALSAQRRGLSAWPSGSSHGFLPATAG